MVGARVTARGTLAVAVAAIHVLGVSFVRRAVLVLAVGTARMGAGALLRRGDPAAGLVADQMGQLLSRERHRVADRRLARRLPCLLYTSDDDDESRGVD